LLSIVGVELSGCAKEKPTEEGDTTPPTISDIAATGVTATTANICWSTDEPATGQVEYGLTTSYGSTTTLDEDLVTSHSVSLSGLTAGTTYHYRVKSKDATGNEAVSVDHTFTTALAVDTTPPAISGVSASDITTSTATITWTTDEPATSQVEHGLTPAYGESSAVDPSLVDAHSVMLSGLTPNTTYHYRVKSKDAPGNEAVSEDNTFITLPAEETSISEVISNPTAWDGQAIEVSGQTFLTASSPKVLVDGLSGFNLSGSTTGLEAAFYELTGIYHADTNTLEVTDSVEKEVTYYPIEEAKQVQAELIPVSVEGLIATVPKEVAGELANYISGLPVDLYIIPYVVFASDSLYLVLSDHFDIMPTEFTVVYEETTYHFYFSAGEVKGTLVKTPMEQIDFGTKWTADEFGGVIIADSIQASEPASATVSQISSNPASFAFKRVAIDGSYLVATATVDYSEVKVPFGAGILADSPNELLFKEEGPRLETIDPERKTWQLSEGQVVGTVLYPTDEVLAYLDYSAPLTTQEIATQVKPVLIVDTLVEDVVEVANISDLNPLTGNPSEYWGKVVEFDGYALGYNLSLKAVASAIAQTEIPVNVNLLAVGIADSLSVGAQLVIVGLNNDLVDELGKTIFGRYKFKVAVTQVPEELVSGVPYADTAFFLLSKEELPYEIPTEFYNLTIDVSPSNSGSVTPPGGQFAAGTQVILLAAPVNPLEYEFDHWSGDLSDSTNPTTITMDSNKSVTAHFRSTILESIEVSPTSACIAVAVPPQTQQFTATGTYSDGSTADITNTVVWTSSAPLVASILPGGLATGVSSGEVTITATVGTVQGSATLTVTAPILESIEVSPSSASIAVLQTQQFTATGTYSDGSTADITDTVIWASSNPGVATVAPGGLAAGISPGTVTITATVLTIEGSATLSVTLF